jgi:hypothetical protein
MSDGSAHQYSVVIKRRGKLWTWEIRRVPELGVRLYGEDFVSPQAAKLAGEEALRELLENLPK